MSSLNITFQYMIFSNFVIIKSSRDSHTSCIMTIRLRYCISNYFSRKRIRRKVLLMSCHEYQIDANRNTIHDPNHYKYPKLTQRFLFAIWWMIYSSSKWLHAKWCEFHLWYEALYFVISFFRDKLSYITMEPPIQKYDPLKYSEHFHFRQTFIYQIIPTDKFSYATIIVQIDAIDMCMILNLLSEVCW